MSTIAIKTVTTRRRPTSTRPAGRALARPVPFRVAGISPVTTARRGSVGACSPAPVDVRRPQVVEAPVAGRRSARATHRTAPAGSVRLTRRGRLVVVATMVLLVLGGLTAFGQHSAATGEAGTPVPTRSVEVGAGDTLWGIAADVAAPGEVREMVHQIEELNALSGPGLTVGQTLAVPVG
jgi:LysM repeat protein